MKSPLSQIQAVILQSMLYVLAVVCVYTPTASCMDAQEKVKPTYTINQPYSCSITQPPKSPQEIQLAQRQYQLMCVYNSREPFATLDGCLWKRIEEKRRNGIVIVLTPDGDSPHDGTLVRTIKEIIFKGDNKYIERKYYEPSQTVAFVTGSLIVGAALYWYFQKTSATSE